MVDFNDIISAEGDNMGGLNQFVFIPVDYVVSIPRAINHKLQANLTLEMGRDWFKLEFIQDTGHFTEKRKKGGGKLYEQKVECKVKKDDLDKLPLVDKMGAYRYLVLYNDNNGVRKLVGSLESPLEFIDEVDSGMKTVNRNEYTLMFNGLSKHKAYISIATFDFNDDFNDDFA